MIFAAPRVQMWAQILQFHDTCTRAYAHMHAKTHVHSCACAQEQTHAET